jgi:hypothetical protein
MPIAYKLANDGQDTRAVQHYLGHLHGIVAGALQEFLGGLISAIKGTQAIADHGQIIG